MYAGGELVHVISFLLQMGFREVGVPFPLEGLNPLQANIAAQLSQLGLLMPFRCPLFSASCPSGAPSLPCALQVALLFCLMPFRCPPLSASCPSGAPSFCLMPSRCPFFLPHALQVPLFLPDQLLLVAVGTCTIACDRCLSVYLHQ
jgi:hypothetical protein